MANPRDLLPKHGCNFLDDGQKKLGRGRAPLRENIPFHNLSFLQRPRFSGSFIRIEPQKFRHFLRFSCFFCYPNCSKFEDDKVDEIQGWSGVMILQPSFSLTTGRSCLSPSLFAVPAFSTLLPPPATSQTSCGGASDKVAKLQIHLLLTRKFENFE